MGAAVPNPHQPPPTPKPSTRIVISLRASREAIDQAAQAASTAGVSRAWMLRRWLALGAQAWQKEQQ